MLFKPWVNSTVLKEGVWLLEVLVKSLVTWALRRTCRFTRPRNSGAKYDVAELFRFPFFDCSLKPSWIIHYLILTPFYNVSKPTEPKRSAGVHVQIEREFIPEFLSGLDYPTIDWCRKARETGRVYAMEPMEVWVELIVLVMAISRCRPQFVLWVMKVGSEQSQSLADHYLSDIWLETSP